MSSVKAPAAGQLYNFCAHKIDSLVFNCPPNETWRFERNQRNAGKGLMRPTRDAFFPLMHFLKMQSHIMKLALSSFCANR